MIIALSILAGIGVLIATCTEINKLLRKKQLSFSSSSLFLISVDILYLVHIYMFYFGGKL